MKLQLRMRQMLRNLRRDHPVMFWFVLIGLFLWVLPKVVFGALKETFKGTRK